MNKSLDNIWMKAAVAGGLWASFEIIVGSLLHNLHLPFSGTLLATCSVILMIAFLQVWNEPGLIWRAGLICGLMKSLSPSAVILGPMTGIMMEAVFMDLVLFLVGRNMLGYILAGISALLSTILHKLASLFILYGTDLVNIYVNLFRFLQKQLGLSDAQPEQILWWILLLYVLTGSAAAVAGFVLGRKAIQRKLEHPNLPVPVDPFAAKWNKTDPKQPFRIILLFLHLIMIPGLLVLINLYGLRLQVLIPAIAYLAFLLVYYKRIKHRLLKPVFWTQLLIMTLVAGFFWHPEEAQNSSLNNGFLVGLEMSLRAILIVSAFSGFSVEIRNPIITNYLLKLGAGKVYAALSLAFNSLPAMLERSSGIRDFLKNPFRSFSNMLTEAEIWLQCYETHLGK